MSSSKANLPGTKLIVALLSLLGIRIALASHINLIEDEAYYRLWGLYPAYGYYDHAPMVGWWIAIGQFLLGDTPLGLRIMSPISAFIGSFFIWRIAFVSFDRPIANLAVILFNAMPMIGIGSILITPDVPSVFFWGIALWALVEWTRSGRDHWWIAFGIAAGLGLLSKYSNVFFGIGVLLWLVVSQQWRKAIRAPQFYIAGFLALLLFAPVLYWNATHDWASFAKQLGRLQSSGITFRYLGEWIAGQALLISPVIFAFSIFAFTRARQTLFLHRIEAQLLLFSMVPMLAYFSVHVFTNRINANWTVPLYPNISILSAFAVHHAIKRGDVVWKALGHSAAYIGLAMTTFVLIEAVSPILPPDKRNPLSQLRGYDDLAKRIAVIAKEKSMKAIVTSRYQMTGLLSYHLPDIVVEQITERVRYLNMPIPRRENVENSVLYIGTIAEGESIIKLFGPCFQSATKLDVLQRSDRGLKLAEYQIWQINGLDERVFHNGRPDDCQN